MCTCLSPASAVLLAPPLLLRLRAEGAGRGFSVGVAWEGRENVVSSRAGSRSGRVYVDQGYVPDDAQGAPYLRWPYTALTRTTERVYLVNWPGGGEGTGQPQSA